MAAAKLLSHLTDTQSHRIKVRVDKGVVTLEGTVETNPERKKIEIGIKDLEGVQGIVNCLCIHQTPK